MINPGILDNSKTEIPGSRDARSGARCPTIKNALRSRVAATRNPFLVSKLDKSIFAPN